MFYIFIVIYAFIIYIYLFYYSKNYHPNTLYCILANAIYL